MTEQTTTIEQTLARRERELDLLLAIDTVRDSISDDVTPGVMFEQLLTLLIEHLEADAAAIVVLAGEGGDDVEYQVAVGIEAKKGFNLCRDVYRAKDKPQIHRIEADGWADGVGVHVSLNNQSLSGVVLLRRSQQELFTEDDLLLLRTAEKQLDSAIVQVRRIWRLAQRNRELDIIYKLDRIRDDNADENDLISSFTEIIIEEFGAKLCMVILSHMDTGEMIVRTISDKSGMKPMDYRKITDAISRLTEIGEIESPKAGLTLLAAPFIITDMQIGAVVVGREKPFHNSDHRLLYALSTQMDSAVVYSRVIQQLTQRNKELRIIYNIDKIRDSEKAFDVMLQGVLGELCEAIDSDIGFILLFSDNEEDLLEIKSANSGSAILSPRLYEAIENFAQRALTEGEIVYDNELRGEVRSAMAVPLVLYDKVIGVFGGINSTQPLGFNAENRRMLNAIVSQVDTAVFERLEQRRVRQVLGRSVDPKVLEHLLQNTDAATVLEGERMTISVLFADLRGSTEWAERTDPVKLAHALNSYLGRMTDVIFEYGGTLDKFVGDEVIGLFGAPLAMDDHAEKCVTAAFRMQEAMAELRQELAEQGYEIPPMGVGVSTGEAICGEFGTSQRTDYTAMGRMMNLGARLCSAAKGGEVVISEATQAALGDKAKLERMTDVALKGIGNSTAYKVIRLNG